MTAVIDGQTGEPATVRPSAAAAAGGLDWDARYTVATMPGVAFWLDRPATEWTEGRWLLDCADPAHLWDWDGDPEDRQAHQPGCYLFDEPELAEVPGRVLAVMVGDDHRHEVDVEDLALLPDDGYCPGCGQTGCGHYRDTD